MSIRVTALALVAVGFAAASFASTARAEEGLWKRHISYQNKQDLIYNYYEGPDPSGTTTAMYISPRPVPAHVGHTYTTYQPYMPHEYMYKHTRSNYAHACGAGWSRSKVRYCTDGLRLDHIWHELKWDCCGIGCMFP
jgi:hypothetical protein